MVAPYDAKGNLCGFQTETGHDMTPYPKLYFTDITQTDVEAIFSTGICVKSCPGVEDVKDS